MYIYIYIYIIQIGFIFAIDCTANTSGRTLGNGGRTLNANMCLEGIEINIWDKQCGVVTGLEKQYRRPPQNKVIRTKISHQPNLSKREESI